MLKSSQEVGLIIKELRIQKGLTQDQLAAKMQLTPQAVSKWENGDSYPDMHIAIMLADLFDISLDELLRNHIDQSQNEKQEYQIHEIIRCKSLSIEVEEIKFQPNQGGAHLSPNLFINLILKNLSKDGIPLAYDHFMLLYDDGSQVDHKKYLRNWDGDVVSELEPYEIPGFIPPLSEAKVKLEYLSKNSTVKLWVNIPDECPHKCIAIKPQLHLEQAHDDLVLSKNIDDIVYFYNYHYKTNQFSKINFKNIAIPHPIITEEILANLIIPKDIDFLNQYQKILDPKIFMTAIEEGKYFDWSFAKRHYTNELEFKTLVKNHYDEVEKQCIQGKCSFLKGINQIEDYMDEDIIEFLIYLNLRFLKNLKEWQYPYLNEVNCTRFLELLKQLNFQQKINIFKTNLSVKIINDILLSGEIGDFPLYKILKLKEFFQDKLYQSTLDNLVLRYDIKTKEELMKLKPSLSEEGWEIAKARYISTIKDEIQ